MSTECQTFVFGHSEATVSILRLRTLPKHFEDLVALVSCGIHWLCHKSVSFLCATFQVWLSRLLWSYTTISWVVSGTMTILLHLLWQSHPSLPNPKLTCQHSKALSTDCVNTAQFPPGLIFWVWDWNRIKSRSIRSPEAAQVQKPSKRTQKLFHCIAPASFVSYVYFRHFLQGVAWNSFTFVSN